MISLVYPTSGYFPGSFIDIFVLKTSALNTHIIHISNLSKVVSIFTGFIMKGKIACIFFIKFSLLILALKYHIWVPHYRFLLINHKTILSLLPLSPQLVHGQT
jgi:hypothetical protein